MDPFDPPALHPDRGPLHVSGQKTETDTDAQPPRIGQRRAKLGDQMFLFRRAERDEDDVRFRGRQQLHDLRHLPRMLLKPLPRAVGADHFQFGMAFDQDLGRALGGSFGTTKKENRFSPACCGGAQAGDQVGSGDPLRQRCPLQPACPDERHSVGDDQIRLGDQRAKMQVPHASAQVIQIGRHHHSAVTGIQLFQNEVQALGFGDRVQFDAVQVDRRQPAVGPAAGPSFGVGKGGGGCQRRDGPGIRAVLMVPGDVAVSQIHTRPRKTHPVQSS